MRSPFTMVPDSISKETVEAFTQLLEQAKAGDIYGAAFVIAYKGRTFIGNTTGECERNLDFARCLLLRLDDKLADRLRIGE